MAAILDAVLVTMETARIFAINKLQTSPDTTQPRNVLDKICT